MKFTNLFFFFIYFLSTATSCNSKSVKKEILEPEKIISEKIQNPDSITIEKAFLCNNKYTLNDVYPYKDTTRCFQWDKIRNRLALLDSIQEKPVRWAFFRNYKNENGLPPLAKHPGRDDYKSTTDAFGVEQRQSVPLYSLNDTITPERYGLDGSLVKHIGDEGSFIKVETITFPGEWFVPKKYTKLVGDSVQMNKTIFIDRTNQNITTLEKSESKWLVRSMNPATTGIHKPPFMHETPLGIFTIQNKLRKMDYYVDGTTRIAGYAPYANRFSSGGYVHGFPVALPRTAEIEYSPTLGTTPRSHMCVRTVTSHAQFIYGWAPIEETVVFIFD